jgi:predicted amidohydrolase YtcJ
MSDSRISRREFVSAAAATLATVAGAAELAAGAQTAATADQTAVARRPDPDLIVTNARVYTMDARMPRAEAFAVTRGHFAAVGASGDLKGLAAKGTEIYDARGMTVLPGFVDCHNHAPGEVLLSEVLVGNPFEVEFVSIRSIVSKLMERARDTPPGSWVEGYFFDDTKLTDQRPLTIRDLDEVSRDHPVVVRHRGGHTSFYNSKAFEMAGITKDTANPRGGTYDRDEAGQLNGRVTDLATARFNMVGRRPVYTPAQMEQRARDGVAYISKQFARFGLTSVHHEGGNLSAMQDVRARGELKHRISYEPSGRVLDAMIAAGIRTGFGDDWIKLGATSEHTVDGSFSERTMALSTPYPGTNPPYKGNVTETPETLNEWVEHVHRAGIQLNCMPTETLPSTCISRRSNAR